jgi:hypothetical protein
MEEEMTEKHISCSTHCCPIHGCKYGHDDCPVKSGEVAPEYAANNGCEPCELDVEDLQRVLTDEVKDKIISESTTLQALKDENEDLRRKVARLEGRSPGTYDVALVVYTRVEDAQDFGDAASTAEMALWQLIRNHGERMPETGTMALYAKHGSGMRFGPVKIAKVAEINTSSYDTGIIRKPGTAAYRFWDLTPEQIEEMNREDMGG